MMQTLSTLDNPRSELFWEDAAPSEHAVQIYGNEGAFMGALEGYVGSGLRRGDGVVVIATAQHLHDLEKRLRASWLDIDRARWEERYIAVLAQETLATFMRDEMPDEALFRKAAGHLVERARRGGRAVRAFGEMVAVLWAEGRNTAALELERMWTSLQSAEPFMLFCAYPHATLSGDAPASIQSVCAAHSRIIPGYK